MEIISNVYFCRICLNWVQCEIDLKSPLERLNETLNDEKNLYSHIKTYMDCYCFVANIQPELEENSSNKLCAKCVEELLLAFHFIRKVQKAEKILHQLSTDKAKENMPHDPLEVQSTDAVEEEEETCNRKNESDEKKPNNTNSSSNYKCEICGQEYACLKKLKIHSRKHEIEPATCEICNKKFATKYNLRLHMRTHEEERTTFDCDECDRKYYNENSLVVHKRKHTGNLLECDECLKKFVCTRELRVHKNSHNRIYQYICDICGARYLRKNHLNTHMMRHQGLKAQCLECGKLFNTRRGLHEHSFVHTGKMPYPCSLCERGYPCRQKYKIHLKKVHDIELNEELEIKCAEKLPIKKQIIKWVKVDE